MFMNLADYNILQDTVQTKEIQVVLDEATRKGGGVVVVPSGTYITGTLNLGGASLYLEKGAVLKGSDNWEDYYANGFVHNEMHECISLIYSMDHDGLSVSGDGVIDMAASAFYDMDSPDIPDDGYDYSEMQKAECTRKYQYRPTQPIFFYNCRHVTVEGIRLQNAPCWTMSFHNSQDIKMKGITIENDMTIPNNDRMCPYMAAI